jgi:hypothetical protein
VQNNTQLRLKSCGRKQINVLQFIVYTDVVTTRQIESSSLYPSGEETSFKFVYIRAVKLPLQGTVINYTKPKQQELQICINIHSRLAYSNGLQCTVVGRSCNAQSEYMWATTNV